MTEWITQFGLADEGWLRLVMGDPDGAERAAQEVADRPGKESQQYAEAVYPELQAIFAGMAERQAAPVAVYVPPVPLDTRPMAPVSAYVQGQRCTPEERNMEFLVDLLGQPQSFRFGEPEISIVELPAGPACRVHEVLLNEEGDDERRFMIEHLAYYVLAPEAPEGIFKLAVAWSSLAIGPEMIGVADRMAASLTVERGGQQTGVRAR